MAKRPPFPKPVRGFKVGWVLPPVSNSWIISIIWLYIALNRTPNIDCYWGGGGGCIQDLGLRVYATVRVAKIRVHGTSG